MFCSSLPAPALASSCVTMKKRPSGRNKRRVADRDADARDADACYADASDHKARRRIAAPWFQVVPGAEHPTWPQHFVDSLRAPLLNLKDKSGREFH